MRVADIIARVFPKCGQLRMTPCFLFFLAPFWGPFSGPESRHQTPSTHCRWTPFCPHILGQKMAPFLGTEIFKVVGADFFIQASRRNGPGK